MKNDVIVVNEVCEDFGAAPSVFKTWRSANDFIKQIIGEQVIEYLKAEAIDELKSWIEDLTITTADNDIIFVGMGSEGHIDVSEVTIQE